MEINDLTPAEEQVWRAFPLGESVDFRTAEDEDVALGGDWGPERTVRAEVLRALLLNGPQEAGEIASLSLAGARITGRLDLQYATIDHPVRLRYCHFDDVPRFYACRLRELNFGDSVLPGLTAHAMRVDGVLRMTRSRFRGVVRLAGAKISGSLFMEGAEIIAPDAEEPVLQLNQAAVGDDLRAVGLRTQGQIRLSGASVAGSVDLNTAHLSNPGGSAVDAEILAVEGNVLVREAHVEGWVGLRGARIAGRLDLSHTTLSNPGNPALLASSSTMGNSGCARARPCRGDSCCAVRRSTSCGWSRRCCRTRSPSPASPTPRSSRTSPPTMRLTMLERDGDGYVPHAYEELAAAYRRVGDDYAARNVQLAKQRRLRGTLRWYYRIWGYVQDATVGYGFRPLRACAWLLSLLAIGSLAYGLHQPHALKASETPHFNPVFYTLDLLLPVVSFGQEEAFAPDGWYQYLAYGLIITGWILATTVVTGVTRSVSRQ